ncbi:MAG: hypothetical protein EAZ97_11880 [Bacteroidetes bacterium]|nr:MAG: hypothetical protein EAZ97_11880 [Bacteroidota bacterium]
MKKNIFFILFLLSQNVFSQVQWADKLLGVSSSFKANELSANQFSGSQALGKPNVLPNHEINACAWSPDIYQPDLEAWIWVTIKNPVQIEQVLVAQNYNAGAIFKIFLYDSKGTEYLVFENKSLQPHRVEGELSNFIVPKTNYKVQQIKVVMNNRDRLGWSHIDAIGVSENKNTVEHKINLVKHLVKPSQKENLGNSLNSLYEEVLPLISPDGKTLYFSRTNHPENTAVTAEDLQGKFSYLQSSNGNNDDIWFSKNVDGTWQKAEKMPSPLNNKSRNAVFTVTPDGNTLLLANRYTEDGNCFAGLSMSRQIAQNQWSFPEELKIKNYYNLNRFSECFLANNGKTILLALQREDSKGGRDLYVSHQEADNSWSEPLNLGDSINTAEDEITPFLAADGKSLYFSSRGHSGFGDSDIFLTKRLDDSWKNWSAPQNLGSELNTKGWDAGYSLDAKGEYAYFVSYDQNNNSSDIFRAKLYQEVRPDPVVLISGKVINSKTNKPISADIVYEILPEGKEAGKASSNPSTGEYKIVLPLKKRYGFWAKAKGFLSIDENINLNDSSDYQEIVKDLYLTPIEIGQYVRLNNVFFAQGKSKLLDESYPELERLSKMMNESPQMAIEISGHTDIDGNSAANMQLSKDRINLIKQYLILKGVKEIQIKTIAYGDTKPITKARDEASKQLNRRVEIKILAY